MREPRLAGEGDLKDERATADRHSVTRFSVAGAVAVVYALAAAVPASAHSTAASSSSVFTQWTPAAPVLVGATLAATLFARGFWTLRRRGRADHAGWSHAVPFLLGLVVLVLALISPLDAVAEEYLLSAHMLQHVLIGDVVPALLVLGVRGPLTFFLLPASVLRFAARTTWLRRTLAFVTRPTASFALWALMLAVWHVPRVYGVALERPLLHYLEHASLVGAGLLVWFQLLDPARRRHLDLRGRVLFAAALFGTAHLFIHPVLLSGNVVYEQYAAQPARLFGLSALADQHWAGVVMTFEQVATLGTFLLVLLRPGLFGKLLPRRPAIEAAQRIPAAP